MLIDFRLSNYRSFREEQVLDLRAGGAKDRSHEESLIRHGRFELVRAAMVSGSNASGKSNLLRGIRFMVDFITSSATKMTVGDRIPDVAPFLLDRDSRSRPSTFEVTFLLGETQYRYGFAVTAERVHEEWLVAIPSSTNRQQRWLERTFDPKTEKTTWAFRGPLRRHERVLKDRTRDNGLVLSRGAEQNIEELSKAFLWFRDSLWPLDLSYPPRGLAGKTAAWIKEKPELRKQVVSLLRHADMGIEDLKITDHPLDIEEMPESIRSLYSERGLAEFRKDLVKAIMIRSIHRDETGRNSAEFDFDDESNGTQRFFALVGPFLDALGKGAVVVVDELGCSMHPLLTRKLIELFQSPEANPRGAQLVFATHDVTLMDPELLRRDQIWLVEKNQAGASEMFSLYDFDTKDRPRNTEAFQRNYLAGRYGGVPRFGPVFEDLEIP